MKNFQALQATDFKDIIENTEAFGCSVCLEDIEPGEGVILRECLHMFCKYVSYVCIGTCMQWHFPQCMLHNFEVTVHVQYGTGMNDWSCSPAL